MSLILIIQIGQADLADVLLDEVNLTEGNKNTMNHKSWNKTFIMRQYYH
jgi:hypothetical protein